MRLLISLVLSIPMIFAVFILMAQLVPANANDKIVIDIPPPDIKPPKFDKTIRVKPPAVVPDREPPPTRPIQSNTAEPIDTNTRVDIPEPTLNPGTGIGDFTGTKQFTGPSDYTDDGDAIPEIFYEPVWPANADRSGNVRFCFSVDTDGRVSNIKLMRSEPGRLFVREARRAIKKWRFRPAMENGKPIFTDNTCYTMVFEYPE